MGASKLLNPQEAAQKPAAQRVRDGWETSESEGEGLEQAKADRRSFCAAVHRQLFEDVSEDFASTKGVLKARVEHIL